MSIFDRFDRLTSREVDRAFSDKFLIWPMQSTPNGRPQRDHSRNLHSVRGILDERPEPASVEIGKRDRAGNDLKTLVHGKRLELSIDRRRIAPDDRPRQGDIVEAQSCDVSETIECFRWLSATTME